MDSAEVYLTLLRPTMVPVFGEAAPIEFTGQVELHGWNWNITNPEEVKKADKAAEAYGKRDSFLKNRGSAEKRKQNLGLDKIKQINKLNTEFKEAKFETEKQKNDAAAKLAESIDKLGKDAKKAIADIDVDPSTKRETSDERAERERSEEISELDRNKNFEFSFSKRVDVATTQMLNSMKAGDVFPTAVMIIHQRSSNSGLSLVFTAQKVRLLDYALKCEVSDTMTDMREEWKAEFFSISYVYKNRKAIKKASGAVQSVATAATQGTVRTFIMKNIGLPI
jgi:type VI protein secretion system component Hcp